MKTIFKASLEATIARWISDNCEDLEWPNVYVYEDLAKDMSSAASLVFDANANGQLFAKEQDK